MSGRYAARVLVLAVSGLVLSLSPAFAQAPERFALAVEGGALVLARNDVRIPNNETATEFSLADAVGGGPYGVFRASAALNFNERHGLRFTVAPLEVNDRARLATVVRFAGQTFSPGLADATYEFSSYRVTYRYRFFSGDRWQWRIGFRVHDGRPRRAQVRSGVSNAPPPPLGWR